MKGKKIVIIGMGPAAAGAAAAIQHTNPKSEITLIDKRDYEMYSPCAMPFAFEEKLEFDRIIHDFASKGQNTNILLNTKVEYIYPDKKCIIYKRKISEDRYIYDAVHYDSLIISTGTKPFIPPIKNIQRFLGTYAYPVNSLENVRKLYNITKPDNKIAIVGAGAIGLEFATAMESKGLEVIVTEMMPQVFPNAIDNDMARHVQEYLEEKGITILTNSRAEIINGNNLVRSITINSNEYPLDFTVLACGTQPNLKLLRNSEIAHSRNGIVTDNRMRTQFKDIYAAGDCVETFNYITKKKCRSALAVPARKQGRVAGINSAGGKATYKGTLNTFISVLDDYAIGATGLTAEHAKQEGYEVIMQKVRGKDKPEWYPGVEDLIIKLVADKKGKLLGGQAFGEKKAVKSRIDTISAHLTRNGKLKDIMDGELSYCPDVAPIPDPLTTAVEFMLRRVKK